MILEEDKRFARAMLGDDVVNEAEQNAELIHSGVKGMKWGVWNAETRARRLKNRRIKAKRKKDAKNRRLLSDKDLKQRVERIELEKKLKNLTEEDVSPAKSALKKYGKKVIAGLGIAGTGAALAYLGRVAVKGLEKKNVFVPNAQTPGIVPYGVKADFGGHTKSKYTYDVKKAIGSFDLKSMLEEFLAKKKK